MNKHPSQQLFPYPARQENDHDMSFPSILALAYQSLKPKRNNVLEHGTLHCKDQVPSLILGYLAGEELGI